MIMFSQKANGSNSNSSTAQDSQNSREQNSEINTTPSESSTPINTTGSDSNTITAEWSESQNHTVRTLQLYLIS